MLSLSSLSTPDFWHHFSFDNGGSKRLPLVIVLPSGRHPNAGNGQLALISDSLYTHEIANEIDRLARLAGCDGIYVRSMLDIDYYECLEKERRDSDENAIDDPLSPLNANILVLATADINVVAQALLSRVKSFENYKCGYSPPYEQCILVGSKGKQYVSQAYPWVGVLAAYDVPWSHQKRVALFSGGIFAVGTLAGTKLLLKYLQGEVRGDNRYSPNVPLRIVSASPREYNCASLIPVKDCMPQHDLRNIEEDAELTIHE